MPIDVTLAVTGSWIITPLLWSMIPRILSAQQWYLKHDIIFPLKIPSFLHLFFFSKKCHFFPFIFHQLVFNDLTTFDGHFFSLVTHSSLMRNFGNPFPKEPWGVSWKVSLISNLLNRSVEIRIVNHYLWIIKKVLLVNDFRRLKSFTSRIWAVFVFLVNYENHWNM